MKQNDAVFQAVCQVLGADGFDGAVELGENERKEVVTIVTAGILSGHVDFSAEARSKYDTESKVRTYVVGMVSNHLRKDKRMNGGVKYETRNPGSRAGSGDDTLRALKALRSTLTSDSDIAQIDEAINARMQELQAAKAKKIEINVEALPAEFRHLVK